MKKGDSDDLEGEVGPVKGVECSFAVAVPVAGRAGEPRAAASRARRGNPSADPAGRLLSHLQSILATCRDTHECVGRRAVWRELRAVTDGRRRRRLRTRTADGRHEHA